MRSTDVAVVGGGPAGIAAALAAAGAGARVVLIDEQPAVGGQLRRRVAVIPGLEGDLAELPGVRLAAVLAAKLAAAGVEVISGGIAWGLFEGRVLGVVAAEASYEIEAGAVVVASGSTDRVAPFPGWTLPGVLTARAAQTFLNVERVLPGRRVVVVGDGPEVREVSADITLAGGTVVARPASPVGLRASGAAGVETVESDGATYDADAVVLALGRRPDPALALQAQAEVEYASAPAVFVPRRSATLETSVPGVYVAGDAGGIVTVAEAMAEGRLAGLSAAGADQAAVEEARERLQAPRGLAGDHVHAAEPVELVACRVLDAPACVCRCEEVTAAAVRNAIAEGATTLNDVKRRTRAGMGLCQGIFCLGTIAAMIHDQAGVPLEAITPMTTRPPARVIPLASLAATEG